MSNYKYCCPAFKILDPVSKLGEWTSAILNKDEHGWPLAFMVQDKKHKTRHGFGFHIRFCPFCGAEILLKNSNRMDKESK